MKNVNSIQISNTVISDLASIMWLFNEAMSLQGKNGYKVWESIDISALELDIENQVQFKIVCNDEIICIFSIQQNDPFIWRERDKNDAIYLHRIVVNPNVKGQRQFEKVLNWTLQFAKHNNKKFVRMDTWADNRQLIDYYRSFGFQFIENYKTSDIEDLPIQNRNLNVALLELEVD